MKIHHVQKIYSFVILLLLVSTTGLQANANLMERSGPITPPNAIYEKMLKHLTIVDTCKFSATNSKKRSDVSRSYDPHSMLIFQTELEAGRVTFYLDAYHGQSLAMEIQNDSGQVVADLGREKVNRNYIQVDLAAWDCGIYYILLMNDHGEVEQYQFVID
ncbi:MAG: hypothetical protein AB8F74_21270 [Saprospiraceae bacterium]